MKHLTKDQMKRMTKAELIEHIESLESDLSDAKRDVDYMNENYYSDESVQTLISEAIEDQEAERARNLRRCNPETHRERFQLIRGENEGAA